MLVGFHRSHEASVVVVDDDDGRPLFAASEERFSRVKMQGGWPRLAAEVVADRFDLAEARAAHGGLPLRQRLLREARLAWYNARARKLQDVHEKRFRKLFDVSFGETGSAEAVLFPSSRASTSTTTPATPPAPSTRRASRRPR